MPARAIEVSFCGAATTASTSPASAALMAVAAKASEARPAAPSLTPKPSAAASGCGQSMRLRLLSAASATAAIARSSALMAQAAAWRSITRRSQNRIGVHAARTSASSAALRPISGPIPAGSPAAMAMIGFSRMGAASLLPGHQRRVDHILHTLAADRADGEVHVLEPEPVGRHQLERKALRSELRQRQLAGLVAVAARALDGDELHGDLLEREVREFLQLALHHDGAGLALERLHAEQDGDGAGAGGAVERDVDALAAGDLHDARQRVLLLHVDHVVGAELLGDLEPGAVLGGAGDDDERGAGLLADHRLRQALLART